MKKTHLTKVLIGIIGLTLVTGCSTDNYTTETIKSVSQPSVESNSLDNVSKTLEKETTVVQEFVGNSGATYQLKVSNLEQKQLNYLEEVIYPKLEETANKYDLKTIEVLSVELEQDSEGLLNGVVRTLATNEQGESDQTISIQDSQIVLYFEGSFDSKN